MRVINNMKVGKTTTERKRDERERKRKTHPNMIRRLRDMRSVVARKREWRRQGRKEFIK